jgi:thiol:disulfide interchange protein DsbD
MKTILRRFAPALLLALAFGASAQAQVESSLELAPPVGVLKAGDKFAAKLTVRIDPGWHIYSITQPDGGPVRSEIVVPKDQAFKLAGKIDAPEPDRRHSAAFDIEVQTYIGEVVFTIPLVATAAAPAGTKVRVEFTYQACTEENCDLPKTAKIEAAVGGSAAPSGK